MSLTWAGVRISALRIAPAFLLVTALASGCHVLGVGASGAASGTGTITVAVAPGPDSAPLSVGVEKGLFLQRGLKVTVRDYQSLRAEVQALAKGQAQVAVGDYTDYFYEQATGHLKLRLIADAYDATPDSVAILALPTSGITKPQDLEGRGVATPPAQVLPHSPHSASVPFNIQTLAAQEVLQNDGVSPSSVTWTPLPGPNMLGALRTGQVKGILVSEPYILQAEEQLGATEVVDASSGVTSGIPMSGYFSLASYAHQNPSVVQAFQSALAQAQSDCAQRGLVQAVLPQLTGMSAENAALVTLGTYPTSLNVGQVQRVATLMYDSGMISSPINVSALVTG
jgi:NitT/TauT family transport system substrate-binding protein